MNVIRYVRILFMILPAVCFTRCGDSYGDFLNDPDNAGVAQWATPVKNATNNCRFKAVAVDSEGNTYAAGSVKGMGEYDFGGNSEKFSGISGYDEAIIVKYNSSGVAQWVTSVVTSPETSTFNSIAVDKSGNIYVSGYIMGTWSYDFGGNSKPVDGISTGNTAVIVKYNASGVAQWARTVVDGGTYEPYSFFYGIAVDSDGNPYVIGSIQGTGPFYFDMISAPVSVPSDSNNPVIVKYSRDGAFLWGKTLKTVPTSGYSVFNGLMVDRSGNAYAVGYVYGGGVFNFGGISKDFPVTGAYEHTVIVKYSASGEAQWATPIQKGESVSLFTGVTVDGYGNAYAVGSVSGEGDCSFGGNSNPFPIPDANVKSVIVKYDSSGTAQWATPVRTAPSHCSFKGVSIDVLGNLYAVGVMYAAGSFDFGGKSMPVIGKNGAENAVIVKYNTSGVAQWATAMTEAGSQNGFNSIAVDRNGYSYAVGYVGIGGSFSFGGKSLPFNGQPIGNSSVIVKYY